MRYIATEDTNAREPYKDLGADLVRIKRGDYISVNNSTPNEKGCIHAIYDSSKLIEITEYQLETKFRLDEK